MNIENMKKLLARLEDDKTAVGFSMAYWFTHNGESVSSFFEVKHIAETHVCGTVACLAGHAVLLAAEEDFKPTSNTLEDIAQRWLDLSNKEAWHLFQGKWSDQYNLRNISKEDAINHLNSLIKTHA